MPFDLPGSRHLEIRPIGSLLLILAALFLFRAEPASAQAYPCNGPGPGERMVGMTQGGNGIAPIPLCVRDAPAGPVAPAGPPTQWVNSHFVAAWHPQSSDVWTAAGYRSHESAGAAALAACNEAMGSGCTLTVGAANGAIAIARDAGGELWAATAATDGKAKKEVEKLCAKEQTVCSVINSTTSPSWIEEIGRPVTQAIVFPPKGGYRRIYASSAWVDGEKASGDWGAKVWVDAGHASARDAETAAVGQCERDSGARCKVVRTVADTFLTVAVDSEESVRVGASPTHDDAKKLAEKRCKDAKTKCTVTAIFDAQQKGSFVHDAYQALAGMKK